MFQFIGLIFIFLCSSTGFSGDFEGAKDFESYDIRGRYTVTCVKGKKAYRTVHYCKAQGMHPFGWARFTHTPKSPVTRLVLTATDESGRQITRKSRWDRKYNQSFKQFNLYRNNIFQNSLIKEGANEVVWTLLNGNTVVESGSFDAHVTRGRHLQCQPLTDTEVWKTKNCKDSVEACQRYFDKVTDCTPV